MREKKELVQMGRETRDGGKRKRRNGKGMQRKKLEETVERDVYKQGGEKELKKEGEQKSLKCIINGYKFPTMNDIIMFLKHVLIKSKRESGRKREGEKILYSLKLFF